MKFVVGDIHGEIDKLESLVLEIEKIDTNPTYIFIGDYIDKGKNPQEVLTFLSNLKDGNSCIFLMGNHEYFWKKVDENTEDIKKYLIKYGGELTMNSFKKENILETKKIMLANFKELFDSFQSIWYDDNYIVTHSGFNPSIQYNSINDIPMEDCLFNRYDFILSRKFLLGRKTIFGHTGFYTPYYDGYKIGIDTAACFLESQPITSFCIEEGLFIDSTGKRLEIDNIKTDRCPCIIRTQPWRMTKL